MSECVRELTARELVEQSNLENKDIILQRMKDADFRTHQQLERYEATLSDQRYLIEAYRTVLKDMVYSNWLNK